MARGLNGSANGSGNGASHGMGEGIESVQPGSSSLPRAVMDVLPAVVGVQTTIPQSRRSAKTLGSERDGHGTVIDDALELES